MHEAPRTRILTVDGDQMMLAMLEKGLCDAGYDILQASSAEEALEIIWDNPPDLAVLDISMPGMSGIELAQRLREQAEIPFMFLSSHVEDDIVQQATQNGAVGYLVKPINMAQVLPSIKAGLARARDIENLKRREAALTAELAIARSGHEDGHQRRTRIEDELWSRYVDLADLTTRLDQVRERLVQSEKLASLGRLMASVAHEINSPIGYIHTNIKTLEGYLNDLFRILDVYAKSEASFAIDDQTKLELEQVKTQFNLPFLRGDIPELLAESKAGIQRVRRIVQDLKDFSRTGSSEERAWADLHSGLDAILNMVRHEVKHKAEIILKYGRIPKIECHPVQLNQVFMNLIVNATQSITDGCPGRVVVRTGADHAQVWVEISDNGCGITPENRALIFNPFFTTKPAGRGLGLGLSISHDIVRKHGGCIEVSSEVGRGSTFRVVLPLRQAAPAA